MGDTETRRSTTRDRILETREAGWASWLRKRFVRDRRLWLIGLIPPAYITLLIPGGEMTLFWIEMPFNVVVGASISAVFVLNAYYYRHLEKTLSALGVRRVDGDARWNDEPGDSPDPSQEESEPLGRQWSANLILADGVAGITAVALFVSRALWRWESGLFGTVGPEAATLLTPWNLIWEVAVAAFILLVLLVGLTFFVHYLRRWLTMARWVHLSAESASKRPPEQGRLEAWATDWEIQLHEIKEVCGTYFSGYVAVAFVAGLLMWFYVVLFQRAEMAGGSVAGAEVGIVGFFIFSLVLVAIYFTGPSLKAYRSLEDLRRRWLRHLGTTHDLADEAEVQRRATLTGLLGRATLRLRHGNPLSTLTILGAYVIQALIASRSLFTL